MFYFLLILGSGLISLGLVLRKRETAVDSADRALSAMLSDVHARRGMDHENTELATDLTDRMEELEKTLFEQLLKWQVEKEDLIQKLEVQGTEIVLEDSPSISTAELAVTEKMENTEEDIVTEVNTESEEKASSEVKALPEEKYEEEANVPEKKPVPDNIRAVMEYEEQGLSVQEIAKITRMKKGEVLLLRNLSKHYKK
ncbi:MAG TPA: hypothetical protein DHM90_09840 [Clostridiaceae bacterium]|nr:hypothetical protein [Clostridiaceae bacterium]